MLIELRDAGRARDFFERTVPFFRDRPHCSQSVEVYSVFPREDWVIVYRVPVADSETGKDKERLLVVHHFPNGQFEKAAARIRRQVRRISRSDPLIGELVAERPEEKLLIYCFPVDPKLRFLAEAADPAAARKVLEAQPACLHAGKGIESCKVQPVRYIPGKRCQFLYTLHRADGRPQQVFGKILREEKASRLYDSMRTVSQLFVGNSDPDLTAPRPLACIPRWGMVVQEKAPGATLYEMLRSGLANESHMRSAARSIAALHNEPLQLQRRHLPTEEWELILTFYRRLRSWGAGGPAFEHVLERLRDFSKSVPSGALVPVHGDFYDKQLIIQGPHMALIDLDALALGFGEMDVANFLVHLRLRALQNKPTEEMLSRWEHAFVDEYAHHAQRRLNAPLQRFFAAKAFFRLAFLYRLRPRGAQFVPELLRLANDATQRECLSGTPPGVSFSAEVMVR